MKTEYIVTQPVFDRLVEINNRVKEQYDGILENIRQAKEYGDLSENASYDTARANEQLIAPRVRANSEYLQLCEIYKPEELSMSEIQNLYKKVRLRCTDGKSKDVYNVSYVLTPSIDLMLSKIGQAYISSDIGKAIIGMSPQSKVWLDILGRKIKIELIESSPYSFSQEDDPIKDSLYPVKS